MDRTLSFAVNKICGVYNKQEWMQEVYEAIVKDYSEDDIEGIQVYPANWPRRVRLMVKYPEVKQKLEINGIDLFGQHVDLDDDRYGPPTTVTVIDAPLEMPFDRVTAVLESYGKVLAVRDEFFRLEGRQTTWKTGTKLVTMSELKAKIPDRLTVIDPLGRKISISLKCTHQFIMSDKLQVRPQVFCQNCGSKAHAKEECSSNNKLCYRCGSESHLQSQCLYPRSAGIKQNEKVCCFSGENAILSNFNKQFPVAINGKNYICNEQYIVHQKALLFDDKEAATLVMTLKSPRQMKQLGNNLKNYDHALWQRKSAQIIAKCNEVKFDTHNDAQKFLLSTGDKIIGEATKGREWGTGISLDEDECLDNWKWTGENRMGGILMKIRDNYRQKLANQQEDKHAQAAEQPPTALPPAEEVSHTASEGNGDEVDAEAVAIGNLADPLPTPSIVDSDDQATNGITRHCEDHTEMKMMLNKEEPTMKEPSKASDTLHPSADDSMDWSNLTVDETHQDPVECVLVIGDSNVGDLLLEGHESALTSEVVSEEKMKIHDVVTTLDKWMLDKPDKLNEVKMVIVHVGGYNFDIRVPADVHMLFEQYCGMLNAISQKLNNSSIILSSILPRARQNKYQEEFSTVNVEIAELNEMLRDLCENNEMLMYMNNDERFISNFEVCDYLYRIHDELGINLSRRGRDVLDETMEEIIMKVYYKTKLQTVFDVNVES